MRIFAELARIAAVAAPVLAAPPGTAIAQPAPAATEGAPPGGHAPSPLVPTPPPLGYPIAITDPSGHALDAFHAALRRADAGEGVVRLTFWGASHVASDGFTGTLRGALQRRFGDAGHGWVVPVRPWRYYRHRGVEVPRDPANERRWRRRRVMVEDREVDRYGLPGVYLESSSPAAVAVVETVHDLPFGRNVGRYEIAFLAQPFGGSFDVLVDGRRRERVHTAAEAPHAAFARVDVPDGPHRLELRVRGDGPVRLFGVSLERDRPGAIVDTLGINGARARYQLQWDEAVYRDQLAHEPSDLHVLAYGTNESGDDDVPLETYEAQLDEVVARLRRASPASSCLLIGPSDRPIRRRVGRGWAYEPRARTTMVIEVQRRVAAAHGCGFFDLVAFSGGPLSMVAFAAHDPPYGAPDHIHFTRRGYERLGEVLLEALVAGSALDLEPLGSAPLP